MPVLETFMETLALSAVDPDTAETPKFTKKLQETKGKKSPYFSQFILNLCHHSETKVLGPSSAANTPTGTTGERRKSTTKRSQNLQSRFKSL